jgi:hypothetical protein
MIMARMTHMPPDFRFIARLVLAVMLVTFLSPSFAWESLAAHDESGHAVAHSHAPEGAAAAQHGDGENAHEDGAHGLIGHLFAHMPAFHSSYVTVPSLVSSLPLQSYCSAATPTGALEPPLPPPRA